MRPTRHVLLACAAAAAACTSPTVDPSGGEPSDEVEAPAPEVSTMVPGTLTACVAPTPDVAESVDGDWQGFDVEVLGGVADELALDLEVVVSSFDEIVSGVAVNGGACEVAAAGLVADDALDAVARTSAPYRSVHRLVVTIDAPSDLVAPEDVTGRVGVEADGTATDGVEALAAAEVVDYPSRADLSRALAEGAVDAALVSVPARAELEADLQRDLELLSAVPTGDETVLVLPLGADDELVEAVDAALEELRSAGQLERWRDRWLRD